MNRHFASTFNLPIIFVVENNLFSSHMHISLRQPAKSTERFAEANLIKSSVVDGNNIGDVYAYLGLQLIMLETQ